MQDGKRQSICQFGDISLCQFGQSSLLNGGIGGFRFSCFCCGEGTRQCFGFVDTSLSLSFVFGAELYGVLRHQSTKLTKNLFGATYILRHNNKKKRFWGIDNADVI